MTIVDATLSIAVLAVGCLLRPTRAHCPDRTWLSEGVRRSGAYVCTPTPIGGEHFTGRAWHDDSIVPDAPSWAGQIYCTGGAIPVDRDGVRVGCEARH